MKVRLIYASIILITLASCQKQASTPPDPTGTLSVSINYTVDPTPLVLYQGIAADGPYVPCPNCLPPISYPYVRIRMGTNASLNALFVADICDNASFGNPSYNYGGVAEIADMGSVKGLGSVTSIPTTGWSTTSALEIGRGYVVRYRATKDYYAASSLPYIYSRLYVTDWVISATNGGIIGAKIKYQNDF